MNACFMCKGVRTNDGFIRLNNNTCVIADKLGNARELRCFDASFQTKDRVARLQCHHYFFERGVARAFTDAVDGHFSLTRARANARQRVGGGESQVIVAMH